MPDEELFALAAAGKLRRTDVLEAQVRRMLKDPKSLSLVENFASQWLNLRTLDGHVPDRKTFPEFNDQLRRDMRRETEMLFAAVMREDRSVLDFIDADFSFINERLAEHYGIENIKGEEFRQASLPAGQRAGVLTHASVLTLTSNPTRTSPVKRGKWILENILGTPPAPPPPNVPALEEAAKMAEGATLRKQLEVHRNNPSCAACHEQLDALGFGFENFDAIGRWRDRDGEHLIDASGTLPGKQTFNGPGELVKVLKKRSDDFSRCLTEKMLTYALGRGLEYYDKCAIDKITASGEENGRRFSNMIIEIVKSDPFRMRRGD